MSYLRSNALFLRGRLLLGHTGGLSTLGLGFDSLLLGRGLARDGRGRVNDLGDTRLGVACLRPRLASHLCVLEFEGSVICGNGK